MNDTLSRRGPQYGERSSHACARGAKTAGDPPFRGPNRIYKPGSILVSYSLTPTSSKDVDRVLDRRLVDGPIERAPCMETPQITVHQWWGLGIACETPRPIVQRLAIPFTHHHPFPATEDTNMASASKEEDESLLIGFTPDRPIMDHPLSSPSSSSLSSLTASSSSLHGHLRSSKSANPRILSFILQVLVMALAVSLFFIFVVIAALLLLHICVAGRALRRHRFQRPSGRLEPFSGLSPTALQALPCFDHGAASGSISDCAVCLDGFREGDRCRLLPSCSHAFHAACVDIWLARVPACPICRAGVVEYENGSVGH
ncbi:hypothetical protein ACLOJK_030571 [Asimina triloba]